MYLVEFSWDGPARLTSIKPKREKNGDDSELAIDLILEYPVDMEKAASLFRTGEKTLEKSLRSVLLGSNGMWRPELDSIKFASRNAFSDHHATISYDNHVVNLSDVKVHKFALKNVDAGHPPLLKFEIRCEPNASDAGLLTEAMVSQDIELVIQPPAQQSLET